jgi:hypothetical protein
MQMVQLFKDPKGKKTLHSSNFPDSIRVASTAEVVELKQQITKLKKKMAEVINIKIVTLLQKLMVLTCSRQTRRKMVQTEANSHSQD